MKFAHLSDVHLGGWREDSLRELGMKAFQQAIEICINEHVGFILISGDLFNVSLPSVDVLKEAANILNKVREHDINVYVIPGSHDYSVSGKTMIDVLESSGLLVNVARLDDGRLKVYTDKTGIKIAGWHGRHGSLEKDEYLHVDFSQLENEDGKKIFMFHTMLEEFKPADLDIVECMSVNSLPEGCMYYAGGHPHRVIDGRYSTGRLAYPGALFPNNFRELEQFQHGGFYIVDDNGNARWQQVKVAEVASLHVDASNKTARQVEEEIVMHASNKDGRVVTLRIEGQLKEGKPSDINFKRIDASFANAYYLLKNTSKLGSREIENIEVRQGSVEEVENSIVMEYLGKNKIDAGLLNGLLASLDKEKEEGESNNDFSLRVVRDAARAARLQEMV